MASYLPHILAATAVWWIATGLVVMVARRGTGRGWQDAALSRDGTGVGTMMLMSLVAAASLAMLYAGAGMETALGTYLGFFGALGIWAWHEAAFLTGFVTGPSRSPCRPGLSGWARFRAAFATLSSHEYALFATLVALAVLTWAAPNKTGLWVFALLWVMRVSAKLNIFFGAPNSVSALLPSRLAYLTTYFCTDRISMLFPVTIGLSAAVFVFLCLSAAGASASHEAVGYTLLAAFMGLAIIEHFLLVLPISDSALWRWAMNTNGK